MTQIKERPILFSAPMVNAILDGSKTQTRRIVKGDALKWLNDGFTPEYVAMPENGMCQFGQAGDRLWVRETWASHKDEDNLSPLSVSKEVRFYRAEHGEQQGNNKRIGRWRPSIHMPRFHSRITLEITNVHIERLYDISEDDAKAEGVQPNCSMIDHSNCNHDEWINHLSNDEDFPCFSAKESFKSLWELINGAESWQSNPWVWAIEFKRINISKVA